MSPELAFVLVLMLLWGPTALWLAYRVARGPHGRSIGFFDAAATWSDTPPPVSNPADPMGQPPEGWVCAICHSVNRRKAVRCYACSAEAAGGTAAELVEVPTAYPGVAVMTAATVPVPGVSERAAGRIAVMAAPACPFLGFRDDPSTRCDFPDPRNLCHAPVPAGTTWEARVRRLGSGLTSGGRSQVVDAAHQASHCLTPAHGRCPRLPEQEPAAEKEPAAAGQSPST